MFAPSDPVAQALDALHGEYDDLTDVALFALTDAQVEARHISSERLVNRAVELALRLAAESASRGLDTKTTMVRETRQNGAAAHQRLNLAKALADSFATTRVAMAAGAVSEAQAEVIVKAVQAIPTDHPGIDADVPARAERALVRPRRHTHPPRAPCPGPTDPRRHRPAHRR